MLKKKIVIGFLAAAVGWGLGLPSAHAGVAPTIGTFSPVTTTWGVGAIALSFPSSNSSGSWSFASSNPAVANVLAGTSTLAILNIGQTTITATQAADKTYDAKSVTMLLTVNPAVPPLSKFPAMSVALTQKTLPLPVPSSPSAGAWSYTVSNAAVAAISGSTLLFKTVGSVTVTATQAANYNWAANSISTTVIITGVTPTPSVSASPKPTVSATPTPSVKPSVTPSVSASASPSVKPTVSVTPSVTAKPSVSASAKTSVSASAKPTATESATTKPNPVLTWAPISVPLTSSGVKIVPPISPSNGLWSYQTSNPSVAVVVGDQVVGLSAGVTSITATQAASGGYGILSATAVVTVVAKAAPVVTIVAKGRVITVTVKGGVGRVIINGALAKVGKNNVTAGVKIVKVSVDGRLTLTKTFQIV